jgi:hypothetical protein
LGGRDHPARRHTRRTHRQARWGSLTPVHLSCLAYKPGKEPGRRSCRSRALSSSSRTRRGSAIRR